MRHLRTYEGYYDPPEPEEHPYFELTLDKLYGFLIDYKIMTENEADSYVEKIGEDYWEDIEQWLNNMENEIDYDKYEIKYKKGMSPYANYWKKQKEEQKHKICSDLAKNLLEELKNPKSDENLKHIPSIEDWLVAFTAKKFNM